MKSVICRCAVAFVVCALAGATSPALAADEGKKDGKPDALPRKAAKGPHGSHPPSAPERRADPSKGDMAANSRSPAPASGSMPKSAATPAGKLGTEPTTRGRLGTDPKPDETGSRPPRLN